MHFFYDFKGFAQAELDLFKPLTVLIGPNGSGKSNVIEAVELFSSIAHGLPLHEITDVVGNGGSIKVRGGLQSCPRHDRDSFSFKFSANIKFEKKNEPFSYYISVRVRPQFRIANEKLMFDNGTMIFNTVPKAQSTSSGDIKVQYNNFARGGHKPTVNISSNRSVLCQYNKFAKNNKKYDECCGVVHSIMRYLQSSFIFDPNPKLMRQYERIGNNVLSRDGANLSSVLYDLMSGNQKKRKTLERMLNWIKQVPDEPYNRFNFEVTKPGDVIFGFQELENGPITYAKMLSDGTLRCLAVLTALETVAENSRVVIEEFDNGLHPSRVHVLVEAISSCCKRRNLNVLVTTHNPATLNFLKKKQLEGVVFCAWDFENKAFNLVRLEDLPRYEEFLERGRLGDLVTQRVVEKYLSPKFEEEHDKKALAWLKSLP